MTPRSGIRRLARSAASSSAGVLDQMRAAVNLGEFKLVHSRCHSLKGNRKGQWSADLDGPYRLLFEPILPDGSLDEGSKDHQEVCDITVITVVRILEAGVDTHE